MEQRIRFCAAPDGVDIAYAEHGEGPPLVKASNWLTHLEFDWRSPVWRHWLEQLARGRRLVRYDARGCGLSEREPADVSLAAQVDDLEAVVEAAGLAEFPLLGISQGGAIAISYAVRHPERVSRLVLLGSYARGWARRDRSPADLDENRLLQSLIRVGWGQANPKFRRVFTTLFIPGADADQQEWFDELQRVSASPEMAERLRAEWGEVEIGELLAEVSVPTLVAHARRDGVVPFSEGRSLAAGIPQARFMPLESENHLLLADEPAMETLLAALREFLGDDADLDLELDELSPRELEVVELVAAGLSNEEIGERLHLSVRTVERHLSNVYAKLRIAGKSARAAVAARYSTSRSGRD